MVQQLYQLRKVGLLHGSTTPPGSGLIYQPKSDSWSDVWSNFFLVSGSSKPFWLELLDLDPSSPRLQAAERDLNHVKQQLGHALPSARGGRRREARRESPPTRPGAAIKLVCACPVYHPRVRLCQGTRLTRSAVLLWVLGKCAAQVLCRNSFLSGRGALGGCRKGMLLQTSFFPGQVLERDLVCGCGLRCPFVNGDYWCSASLIRALVVRIFQRLLWAPFVSSCRWRCSVVLLVVR